MLAGPSVGVVIANHNNAAFVARAIRSVADQSYRKIDVAIVDDASTDDSDSEIRHCLAALGDPRFRYVRLAANAGQTGAIRRGLAMLESPFVAFLDSDDCWYEDFVGRHVAAHLNADFPVALSYCDSHIIDAEDELLAGTAWWIDWSPRDASRTIDPSLIPRLDGASGTIDFPANGKLTFHEGWSGTHSTNTMSAMMFRRPFVDLVLTVPDDALRLYLDYYLSSLACLLTGSIRLHDALYGYRMHGGNRHSNAPVFGGTFSSSTNDWTEIRAHVLGEVDRTLKEQSAAICVAFGSHRHAEARRLVRVALGGKGRTLPDILRSLCRSAAVAAGLARPQERTPVESQKSQLR
jgi:glycosyltransferase involved in cell wall biosynthesis